MAKEYRARGAAPKAKAPKRGPKGPPRLRWVFHGPPITAPGGSVPFMVPEEIADDLARHLERLSFWTKDELADLANEDGTLNINVLPDRTIRHDPPAEGPLIWPNPGPWVPVSEAEPVQRVKINPADLTDEQADALAEEKAEIEEALRRREQMKMRYAEADPHVRGEP